jgi:hypothetical protein
MIAAALVVRLADAFFRWVGIALSPVNQDHRHARSLYFHVSIIRSAILPSVASSSKKSPVF